MSKNLVSFPLVLIAFLQILQFVNNSGGQDLSVEITLSKSPTTTVEISGSFSSKKIRANSRNLAFTNEYAGVDGLGGRISDLKLFDGNGKPVLYRRFMVGEYVADGEFSAWQYRVDLTPFAQATAGGHISWIKDDAGLLMLKDLLPSELTGPISAKVTIKGLPQGWNLFSECPVTKEGIYELSDLGKATFAIGRNWRQKETVVNDKGLRVLVLGQFQFSDDDALKLASEIFENYLRMFGAPPVKNYQIAISKFPVSVPVDNWEADTRGSSIVILSSDTPFKTQSIQRLHEQLRHEIFHLWIPNGVNLSGNYDWFYEGFALYQSLKLGVSVNRITFDDYLDTLSRADDIDRHNSGKLSLIDASKDRWNGANTRVYARGMLVAFLCDLALLQRSKGKASTTDLVRELYERHRPPAAAEDGNAAVLALMRSHPELIPIIDRNILGAGSIDWASLLQAAGLEADADGRLKVSAHPKAGQKDLLDKLGYNNWRKLPRTKK